MKENFLLFINIFLLASVLSGQKSFVDGYIFLKPIKKLTSCTIDSLFLNDTNWQHAYKNIPDPDWRPKPNSLSEYWKQIYDFADIVKYYEKTDEQ